MNNSVTLSLPDEAATLSLAAEIAHVIEIPSVIFLKGDLGVGKTTFSRGFLQGLGHEGPVKSPTYTLVEPYAFENFSVFHFDLYRVQNTEELEFIGIRDYFTPHAICLIEWPEQGGRMLASPDLSCEIQFQSEGRSIKITAYTVQGEKVIRKLKEGKRRI